MKILTTDWGDVERVVPLAMNYHVGIEVAEFTIPENIDQASTKAQVLREKLSDIPLVGMHAPFAELVPASKDPLVRQVARTRIQQGYEVAQLIGARHLVFHSGYFPKTYQREQWIQNSYNFWIDFLDDKGPSNFFHMENVYEDDYSSLEELVDRVNQTFQEDRLTICLDIGHVNANSSKSLAEWISGLGSRIRYVHLHNNEGVLDDHLRLD